MRWLGLSALCLVAGCGEVQDDIAFAAFECEGGPAEAVDIARLEVLEAPANGRCAACSRGGCKILDTACRCGSTEVTNDITVRALFDGLQIRTRKVDAVCVRVLGYRGGSPVRGMCACNQLDSFDARSCSDHSAAFMPGDGRLVLGTSCSFGTPLTTFDACVGI